MRFTIIAVGKRLPNWVNEGYQAYARRLPPEFKLHLKEINPVLRSRNESVATTVVQEGERILNTLAPQSKAILLAITGERWDTPSLAQHLARWREEAKEVSFIIGGADGLSAACYARADTCWSLSPLTFPHPLVRIMVVEQLYRAWSLWQNHPYHR